MKTHFLPARALAFVAACLVVTACSKPPEPGRTPKFYQSPMHPWITSDKPGSCTICGMQLVPVYDEKPTASEATLSVSPNTAHVIGLETATATTAPINKEIRLSGILEDDDTLHRVVAAFYDGRIEQVFVQQVGEKVKAGQPLASIYSPELLYVVREFQNASARGKNDPVAINSRHRLIQYGLSPAQVDGLANAPREKYSIDLLAPADGTILVRNAYQGQYVKNGERLFELGNLARMWFKAEIYERDLPFIRVGQKALITTPAVPGRTFAGTVTFLDPSFDPVSRSTKIRIEVDNPLSGIPGGFERVLPHRAYAEARIQAASAPVLTIPRTALIRDGSREVVYLQHEPGQFEMVPVQAGRSGDDRVEIVKGLQAGAVVAARGNLMLDAESQLRAGALPAPQAAKPLPASIAGFLQRMAAVSKALSSDNLKAARQEASELKGLPEIPQDMGPAIAGAVAKAGPLEAFPATGDLSAARKIFLPWSTAAADLALALKSGGYDVPVKVFECPMTAGAFPGAPSRARWVQTDPDTTNPYLGLKMRDCGSEVKQ